MIEALPALFGVGIIATVGFLMARSYNARRTDPGSSTASGDYWSRSEIAGSSTSTSDSSDRSGSSWFSGWFGSSHESSSAFDSGGGSSDSGGGGGGSDGGGGGGGD
jgi:hypothetical protein